MTARELAGSFPLLTPGQLDDLAALSATIKVVQGGVLLREGHVADAIYRITEGVATVTKNLGGVDIVVAELAEGELIGEMSFAGNFAATATVTAAADLTAIKIDKAQLMTLLEANPVLGMAVFRSIASTLSQRLLQMTERFAFLST